ncbi:MAG: 3-oxoacyl-ACP reductase FabG [Candidatus Bipolaricaulota bacterium]|nr:3-oxoacyl-ACP reductase FabG [Candidatus Bipolaricaulota bacterium]MCS7198669.1 3-oxoacyl-ACP reductase FabG [Candidatus Bipolaricaulota bacterium]MDW8110611.1 3-oxoacyl-ACP reductase FabG [Candidatus Bipolaricaulota bacterium]MDW8329856.1 3-oxoacyl-ACP reductase FabG [Candidatus Bipolaricaulota bacterium]
MRLKEKVTIITGAARGIGRETALLFAREGARVVVSDIDVAAGEQTAAEIQRSGGRALFVQTDVSKRADAQRLVEKTVQEFGRIDVLLNNAGILRDATLLKMTEEQFDQVIAVNLKGTFNCTQAVAPVMIAQGKGKIINVSSVVGLYGNFGQTNYVATKAGVIGMTKVWARELGRKGICVNVVAPGFITTEMVKSVPEKVIEMMKERIPLGRLGEPREVAQLYLFLASDESDYINGAVISIDGGITV